MTLSRVSVITKKYRANRRKFAFAAVLLLIIVIPLTVFWSRIANRAKAATTSVSEDSTTITVNVANKYRAIFTKDDTTDFLKIYDRAQSDTAPNLLLEEVGPYIDEGAVVYQLRYDPGRTMQVVEASDTRVVVEVWGSLCRTANENCLDDGTTDFTVMLTYTFTPYGMWVKNVTDFKTSGVALDSTDSNDGYNWINLELDGTDAAFTDTATPAIYYVDGTTESSTTVDGVAFEDSNVYVVAPGASTYQSMQIGVTNWLSMAGGTDDWYWDENYSGTLDVLTARERGTTPTATKTMSWFVLFTSQGELDSEAEREAKINDQRNPDTLSFTTGSAWNEDGTDTFNEFQAINTAALSSNQMNVDIDGNTYSRFTPIWKFKNWRNIALPTSVSLEGTVLGKSSQYNLSYQPLAYGFWAKDIALYTSLEASGTSTTPNIGPAAGAVDGTTTFEAAKYGNGARFDADGESITYSGAGFTSNTYFDAESDFGTMAVEFWFKPTSDDSTATNMGLFQFRYDGDDGIQLIKQSAGALLLQVATAGTNYNYTVATADYERLWEVGKWMHFRAVWDDAQANTDQQKIYINGIEPTHTDPGTAFTITNLQAAPNQLIIGNITSGGASEARGVIDEFYVFSPVALPAGDVAGNTGTRIAMGGNSSSDSSGRAYTEYFNSPNNNLSMSFYDDSTTNQADYLYVGGETKFEGLNSDLATVGSGSSPAIDWEYWNGTVWSALTVTDTTSGANDFTASGNFYFSAPSDWAVYSINTSPELYFIRAHLESGTLTTVPVEKTIRSDVLTFQYLGDITAAAQTFQLPNRTQDTTGRGDEPLAHWGMDENSGSIAYDKNGQKNLTITNAVYATNGNTSQPANIYLSFDGTGDLLSRAYDADFNAGSGGFSWSGWFRHASANPGSIRYLVSRYSTTGYKLYMNTDGTICFGLDNDTTWAAKDSACSTTDLADDTWHHVLVSKVGTSSIALYIDGLLINTDSSLTVNGSVSGSSPTLYVGIDSDGSSGSWSGYLDNVKYFTYGLTASQAKLEYNGDQANVAVGDARHGEPTGTSMPAPTVRWKFDEGSGTTAYTSIAGSSINGTITSGTWTQSGKFDKALTFTASTSVAGTITDPGYTNSLSLWVYPTTSALSKTLITSGKLATNGSGQPTYGTCTGTALSVDTWTHIVAVSNGVGSCAIYQNGILTHSNTTGVTLGTSLNVGATSFTGTIDEINYFNVALTAGQIKVLYNNSSSLAVASQGGEANLLSDGSAQSSLIGYWPLDENTDNSCAGGTNDVCDRTANGNNGASSGSPLWIPGKYGSGLNFSDGSSQYVNIGDVLNITDSQDFSVSGWFYWVKGTSHDAIIAKYNNVGWRFYISVSTDKAIFSLDDGPDAITIVSTPTITQNQWYHFAAVYDDSSDDGTGIWLNGQKVATATGVSAINDLTNTGSLRLGAINAGASFDYFNGRLDDLKYFSSALTPAQIAYEYNRGGPVGWWRLDECSGTSINDLSGYGLTGTLTIGATPTNVTDGDCLSNTSSQAWSNGKSGKINSSLFFDDADDYVSVADTAALDLTSGLTLAAWVKTRANEADNVIISKGTSYEMGVTATGALYWDGVGAQVDDGKTLVGSGTWHHVAITNNDTTATYYVDGIQSSTSAAGVDADNATTLYIGYDGTNYFDGHIDDVRVYNYPLSASQIRLIMNGGAARFE